MAEHTKILELPASVGGVKADLSNNVESGRELLSLTSETVNLLIKISSPFQEVWSTSPGGSSEISSSLYESLMYLVLVIIC